jgi:hypothetical protein
MANDILLIEEDQAVTVALALAEEICEGCALREQKVSPRMFCRNGRPCQYFHPANFYYDTRLKRFWCHNWTDKEGRGNPWEPTETSPAHTA